MTHDLGRIHLHRNGRLLFPLLLIGLLCVSIGRLCVSCKKESDSGADPSLATRGSIEVTAQLTEIPGEFPDIARYDYVYILKYEVQNVHRGKVDSETIYVGHYNPRKPRAKVADARVPEIGGNLDKFRVGKVHRMALEVPIDDYYMGGIINKYFREDTGPLYFAVWTNRVIR